VAPGEQQLDEWLADEPSGADLAALAMARPGLVRSWFDRPSGPGRVADVFGPSYAYQARGLAARETGDAGGALRYLRRAVNSADRLDGPDRRADTRASLAATLTVSGRPGAALGLLEEAIRLAPSGVRAQVEVRQAAVLDMLGRPAEALGLLASGIRSLRKAGDSVWEARALSNRALILLELGQLSRARRDLERAEALFAGTGQVFEAAACMNNLGWAAYRAGDLPAALSELAEADERYGRAGVHPASMAIDRCAVLLASGLVEEAFGQAEEAVQRYAAPGSHPGDDRGEPRAQALLVASRAGLAAGHPERAAGLAGAARRIFVRLGNRRMVAVAGLALLDATSHGTGDGTGDIPAANPRVDGPSAGGGRARRARSASAERLVAELALLRAPELVRAQLLAGRLARAAGRPERASELLDAAAAARHRGPALDRATGWLARTLAADLAGSAAGVLRAADAGLRVLERDRLALGATELRAYATAHADELGMIAMRYVVRSGDARDLLAWSERVRATALDSPASTRDDRLVVLLGELRQLNRDSAASVADGRTDASTLANLRRRQGQLERAVRDRARQRPAGGSRGGAESRSGTGVGARSHVDLDRLHGALGSTSLVSLVDVAGRLHGVVVSGGSTRQLALGPFEQGAREADFARYALRSVLAGATGSRGAGADERLRSAGDRLQRAILGPLADMLPPGPVVLVPPARLHRAPWGLLPVLDGRAFSVAPSARMWLRRRTASRGPHGAVVLVHGPDLDGQASEIELLIRMYPQARVLRGDAATVAAVLAAVDGAELVHVAAHGTFRGDSPMFSALRMADGALTIHDLDGLRRPPRRLVLSSCDAGMVAGVGADELLGLVGALMAFGSAGVLASVLPVPDAAAARFSLRLHQSLLTGADFDQALFAVRSGDAAREAGGVERATSQAFVAFGAG
jgi:tetratricopeptide (TPR) repeat protein